MAKLQTRRLNNTLFRTESSFECVFSTQKIKFYASYTLLYKLRRDLIPSLEKNIKKLMFEILFGVLTSLRNCACAKMWKNLIISTFSPEKNKFKNLFLFNFFLITFVIIIWFQFCMQRALPVQNCARTPN